MTTVAGSAGSRGGDDGREGGVGRRSVATLDVDLTLSSGLGMNSADVDRAPMAADDKGSIL